jgi:hypothetical protein
MAEYARIVRFTDVTQDQIDRVVSMIEESDGPPEGVDSTGMKLVYDSSQGTATFIGFFSSQEAMQAADEILRNMDAGDTPGTRQSIDQGEIVVAADG